MLFILQNNEKIILSKRIVPIKIDNSMLIIEDDHLPAAGIHSIHDNIHDALLDVHVVLVNDGIGQRTVCRLAT